MKLNWNEWGGSEMFHDFLKFPIWWRHGESWLVIYSSSEAANWSIELIVSAVDAEFAVRNADFCFFGSDSSSSDILRFLKFLILKNHFVIWQLFWGVILKSFCSHYGRLFYSVILKWSFGKVTLKVDVAEAPQLEKVFHLDFPTSVFHLRHDKFSEPGDILVPRNPRLKILFLSSTP